MSRIVRKVCSQRIVASALIITMTLAATTVQADSISDYIQTRVEIEVPSDGDRFQAGSPVGFRIRAYWDDTGRGTATLMHFVANQLSLRLDYGDGLNSKIVRSFLPFERVDQGYYSDYIVTDRELNRVSDAGIVFPGIDQIARDGIDPGSRFWSSTFFHYGSTYGLIWTPDPRAMAAGEYQATVTVGELAASGAGFGDISSQAHVSFTVGSPPSAQSTPTPSPAPVLPTPSSTPSAPAPTQTWSAETQDALSRLNDYRQSAGTTPLALHPQLMAAAENHANYFHANRDYTGLDETPGNPGFTGSNTQERVSAAGYPIPAGRSRLCVYGATSTGDDTTSETIDGLVNTVDIRSSLLSPLWVDVGFGITEFGAAIVLGSPTCQPATSGSVILSPGPGQSSVPEIFHPPDRVLEQIPDLDPNWLKWGRSESTVALGTPISIGRGVASWSSSPPIIETAELTDQFGFRAKLIHHVDDSWIYLIPDQPLNRGQTYSVRVKGRFTEQPVANFDHTWTFTTESAFTTDYTYRAADDTPKSEYRYRAAEEPTGHVRFYAQTAGASPVLVCCSRSDGELLWRVPGYWVSNLNTRSEITGFLDMFESLGFINGVPNIGYPLSNVVSHKGFDIQFFQRGVMRRFGDQIQFLNIFDDLAKLSGVDGQLEARSRIPIGITHPEDDDRSIDEIETRRLKELRQVAPAVHAFVTQFPRGQRLARFGLPVNWRIYDDGVVGVRFQRSGFRQEPGETNPAHIDQVLSGEMAKKFQVYLI